MSGNYPYSRSTQAHWQDWHWQLRELLNTEWNPLGVASPDGADDEYDGYVNGIETLWHKAGSEFAQEIGPYLTYVAEDHMGLGPTSVQAKLLMVDVAGKILVLGPPP